MKLHSAKITHDDIMAAARRAGVTVDDLSKHGSRSHGTAFSVYLEGSSPRQSNGRDHKAATWDEWGMVMADLYRIDPNAMWGSKAWGYTNADDFHDKTQNRFAKGMPYDLHTQHKWQYSHRYSRPLSDTPYYECTGCSALRHN